MPTTAKDALSEAGISGEPAKSEKGSQASSAASAEIPVTVHASRYSSVSKGTGKLPPVHEDTRTVIILPQGAVVRLSATVAPGELVVLTNNRTGTDVICRVTSVKTQPGIQNYVHLEFTQRALDFWEENSSKAPGVPIRKSAPATVLPPASPVRPPVTLGNETTNPPVVEAQPAPTISAPAAEVQIRVPTTEPKITPLADLPAGGSSYASAKAPAASSRASEIIADAPAVHRDPSVVSPATPRFQPFETAVPPKATKSRSIILFAMAAAVLAAIGGMVGPEVWQRYRTVIPGLKDALASAEPAPSPVPSETRAPLVQSSAAANPAEPVTNTPIEKAPPETAVVQSEPSQRATEAPKAEAQPFTRPALNIGKIAAPRMKRSAQMNSSEPPPILSADAIASPNIISQSLSTAAPQAGALPAPAVPAPRKGGELEQPKLLSSTAAVYPSLARAQGAQGDVTIDALIDANGRVSATNVLSGSPLLQKAAVDALRLWKYQPAKLNGEFIPIHIKVTISFHLN